MRFTSAGMTRLGALADSGSTVADLEAAAAVYLGDQGDPLAAQEARLR